MPSPCHAAQEASRRECPADKARARFEDVDGQENSTGDPRKWERVCLGHVALCAHAPCRRPGCTPDTGMPSPPTHGRLGADALGAERQARTLRQRSSRRGRHHHQTEAKDAARRLNHSIVRVGGLRQTGYGTFCVCNNSSPLPPPAQSPPSIIPGLSDIEMHAQTCASLPTRQRRNLPMSNLTWFGKAVLHECRYNNSQCCFRQCGAQRRQA